MKYLFLDETCLIASFQFKIEAEKDNPDKGVEAFSLFQIGLAVLDEGQTLKLR